MSDRVLKGKRLSPAAIVALKEALCSIYWYKADLRSFLTNSVSNKGLVGSLNWNNYKRQIVADLVDALTGNQDRYLGDLTKLCYEVTSLRTFAHEEVEFVFEITASFMKHVVRLQMRSTN